MANFNEAYKLTGHNEGGYADNHSDKGGETVQGIARNFWPNWPGWNTIDQVKPGKTIEQINRYLNSSALFQEMVFNFYRDNFWDVNKLDLINDQQIANSVYDFGVNSGTGRAAKYLQKVAGTTPDGIIGNKTIAAINNADAETLYEDYNDLRRAFYNSIAIGDQKEFLHSWLSRLTPYKQQVA